MKIAEWPKKKERAHQILRKKCGSVLGPLFEKVVLELEKPKKGKKEQNAPTFALVVPGGGVARRKGKGGGRFGTLGACLLSWGTT